LFVLLAEVNAQTQTSHYNRVYIDPDDEYTGDSPSAFKVQIEKGAKLLKECIRRDPKNPVFFLSLAEAYHGLKRHDEAISYAEKAIQLDPDYEPAYVGLGFLFFEMKKLKEAKQSFERALSVEPDSTSARYNLGLTCLALNQRDCAREQYAILKTVEPVLSTRLFNQIYSGRIFRVK
jgi:tetratricopeptide (TPR) repeat protein